MERNRVENVAGIVVMVFLGVLLIYGLWNGQPIGALPFLLGIAIREIRKGRRGTQASPPAQHVELGN